MREKYIVTADCLIDRKHTPKGTRLELDTDDPREAEKIKLLDLSGRLALDTPANAKAIDAEVKSDAKRDAAFAATLARAGTQPAAERQTVRT